MRDGRTVLVGSSIGANGSRPPRGVMAARSTRNPWLILAVVAGFYGCFGLVNTSIAPLIDPISRDLQASATQMGAVLGTWQLVYVGTALFVGLALDRFGMRRALIVGMLLVAASAALRGLATDFATLAAAVALFGIGGPTISIAAPKLAAALFSDKDRATALGIATAANFIGSLVALSASNSVLLPLLGNWRNIMFLYGAVVLAVVVLWWIVAPHDVTGGQAKAGSETIAGARSERAIGGTSGSSVKDSESSLRDVLRLRNVIITLAGAALLFTIAHGSNNWIVAVLQAHSYSPTEAGYWSAIGSGLSAVSVLTIPRLVPAGGRKLALMAIFLTLAFGVLGLVAFDGLALNLAIVAWGLTVNLPMTMYFLVLIDTPGVGSKYMGVIGGAWFAVAEIGGFGGPFAMGALYDRFGSFVPGFGLLFVLALVLAGMAGMLDVIPYRNTAPVLADDTRSA